MRNLQNGKAADPCKKCLFDTREKEADCSLQKSPGQADPEEPKVFFRSGRQSDHRREVRIMSKETTNFYRTKAWKRCKQAYLTKVNYLCELCQREGLITPAEAVHHIKPITPDNMTDPNITLNHNNLMAVCRKHHDQLHHRKDQRYSFDHFGNLIMKEDPDL